ncbi:MAG: hypothetical protein JNJ83_19805 [Verrucomicrobiaceae bacterium]|nr:hypothetical protein [Verrucomicrobiaceae bacterium]
MSISRPLFLVVTLLATPAVAQSTSDLFEFGSGEPLPRQDMPDRGIITLTHKQGIFRPLDHWEQYDWKFDAKRWGHYELRLNYTLNHAGFTVQFKHGETRLKKKLGGSPVAKEVVVGELFIADAGPQELSLYAPQSSQAMGLAIEGVRLVPTNEGEPLIPQAADGKVVLLAKDATTWSETMRYEPKPEKNCLGYWTSPDDFAEWEFQVTKPGKYKAVVSYGCGGGNHGSEVEVKVGDQSAKFTVEDTGGFQKWKEIEAGIIEIKAEGSHRLIVDPVNKTKSAVLDIQKVVLVPAA